MFQTSESIKSIAPAYLEAQKNIQKVIKSEKNTFFKKPDGKPSTYASLADVIEAVKGPLNESGLELLTPVCESEKQNWFGCEVVVIHAESGEWYKSFFELPAEKATSQGAGSAGSYVQRYALVSFFSLPQEDDDGNKASGNVSKASSSHAQPVQQSKPVNAQPVQKPATERQITDAERKTMNDMRVKKGLEPIADPMTYAEWLAKAKEVTGK